MRKVRLYFALFSVLLAIPIAVLLRQTYSNLEQESFFFYRKTAEGLTATLHQQLLQNLQAEETRPYTHYRYVHVPDQPLPKQEGLNLSPLAGFPVESGIPGIQGYYQIDPDGSFHTPLLPDGEVGNEIALTQIEERTQVRDLLASILQGQTFSPSRVASTPPSEERFEDQLEEEAQVRETALSVLRQNLESTVDDRLEKEYYRNDQQAGESRLYGQDQDQERGGSYLRRRVQKTSQKQALVFDSKLKQTSADELDKAGAKDPPAASPVEVQNRAAELEAATSTQSKKDLVGSLEADADASLGSVAEVDPFRSQLIDGEWLVFYRKVWWSDRRYIQGFVARFPDFLQALVEPSFLNSPLPDSAVYLVFYRGEPLQPSSTDDPRPLLLHSSALPHPLSEFHLAITVPSLPRSPGYQVANFLALFLSLLFVGGMLGIYRLTSSQMELSQKKSDFVSAVSHELKTPLTAIRMYGEMLMEGWVEEEKRERYYHNMHHESERLSRLIENVLTLAQLERNEWQIDLQSLSPVELVEGIGERLGDQLQRAGFELETVTEGVSQPILVDRDALTQVLINLIDNAIKFSNEAKPGKILLTVSQVGSHCYIRVRDFGPGIPRRQLKQIFEKFYRVDDEMTRTTRGTGIGLALVKMLTRAMGGHVDVANRNPGAEFSLRFPLASPGTESTVAS